MAKRTQYQPQQQQQQQQALQNQQQQQQNMYEIGQINNAMQQAVQDAQMEAQRFRAFQQKQRNQNPSK